MYRYPQVVVFKDKVYIGGGDALTDWEKQTVMVYDPNQDTYNVNMLPPYTYKYFAMAFVNNRIVLVGGRNVQTNEVSNKLGVWNEQSQGWTHPLPPMTKARRSPSVATHNDRWLVVIGGYNGSYLSNVEILDTTKSRQWHCAASLPQPHGDGSSTTIGNMCYLLGGFTEGSTASKKVISVCLDDLISQAVSLSASASSPPTWQSLPDTPLIRSTALAFNGALLVLGGGDWFNVSTAIYHYQPSHGRWIKAGKLSTARLQCTCTVLPNGDLYVAGGGNDAD